jgi:phosphatidylglycerophosphate synthase
VTVDAAASPAAGGPRQRFTLDDVRTTYKRRDAWWTVLLVDPVAARLTLPIANRTSLTPNHVSFASFVVGVLSAAAFTRGDHAMLVAGALLYHVSFVLDCIDGKIARLKGTGSAFGMWLDFSFDQYKFWLCAAALGYGQYQRTGEILFVWMALFIAFFDMLRYLNAWQVAKVRREMDRRLRSAARATQRRQAALGASYAVHGDRPVRYVGHAGARDEGYSPVPGALDGGSVRYGRAPRPASTLHDSFFERFAWWPRLRDAVMRHRVRPHLFSGIEYQMSIFVLGPIFDAVVPFVLVSAVLLLLFEVALVYKLLLSSRDFEREMRRLVPATAEAEVTAAATAAGAPGAGQLAEPPPVPLRSSHSDSA